MQANQFYVLQHMFHALMSDPGCRRVTKFISPKFTLKATYRGKRATLSRQHEILVTFGAPNYAENKFIKRCLKAGEAFPVKKLQLYRPKPKKRTAR